jgi:hypothetical protein
MDTFHTPSIRAKEGVNKPDYMERSPIICEKSDRKLNLIL